VKILSGLLILASAAMLAGCGTSQEATNFWRNPKASKHPPYKSIFVVALTRQAAARATVEKDLAEAVEGLGLKATRSVDVFPGVFSKETAPSKEVMLAKIRELGCDAIFTVSPWDVKNEQRFVVGASVYSPSASTYYWSGGFSGYYGYVYPIVADPGHYTGATTYFLEGNLFDAKTEEIQWSMQSKAYNPRDLEDLSKGYVKLLIFQLERN
jgi:hypothetical protein